MYTSGITSLKGLEFSLNISWLSLFKLRKKPETCVDWTRLQYFLAGLESYWASSGFLHLCPDLFHFAFRFQFVREESFIVLDVEVIRKIVVQTSSIDLSYAAKNRSTSLQASSIIAGISRSWPSSGRCWIQLRFTRVRTSRNSGNKAIDSASNALSFRYPLKNALTIISNLGWSL